MNHLTTFDKYNESFNFSIIKWVKNNLSKLLSNDEVKSSFNEALQKFKELSKSDIDSLEVRKVNESNLFNKIISKVSLSVSAISFITAVLSLLQSMIGNGMKTLGLPLSTILYACISLFIVSSWFQFKYEDRYKKNKLNIDRKKKDLEIDLMEDSLDKDILENEVKYKRLIEDVENDDNLTKSQKNEFINLYKKLESKSKESILKKWELE